MEIKTFTGKKTLMNAVALVLHAYSLCGMVYKMSGGECIENNRSINYYNMGIKKN